AELVVLEQHVRLGRERAYQRLSLGLGEVHCDRLLPAVGRGEVGGILRVAALRVFQPRRAKGARIVANLRSFHLDDLGAEIGEVLSCPGRGEDPGEIENANMRKRARHQPMRSTSRRSTTFPSMMWLRSSSSASSTVGT